MSRAVARTARTLQVLPGVEESIERIKSSICGDSRDLDGQVPRGGGQLKGVLCPRGVQVGGIYVLEIGQSGDMVLEYGWGGVHV